MSFPIDSLCVVLNWMSHNIFADASHLMAKLILPSGGSLLNNILSFISKFKQRTVTSIGLKRLNNQAPSYLKDLMVSHCPNRALSSQTAGLPVVKTFSKSYREDRIFSCQAGTAPSETDTYCTFKFQTFFYRPGSLTLNYPLLILL